MVVSKNYVAYNPNIQFQKASRSVKKMKKIIIADDHAIVRKGLKEVIKDVFPSARVEEVEDAESLVKRVIKEDWDLVITDISMPGRSGLDALHQIMEIRPKLPVLVLSIYPEEHYGIRVLKAGAYGYLSKMASPSELTKALQTIHLGKKYITPQLAEKLISVIDQDATKAPHELLSDREFEVFKMLAQGKSVSEIAAAANLSVTTVSTYRARILAKMDMKTNADIIHYAIEKQLA